MAAITRPWFLRNTVDKSRLKQLKELERRLKFKFRKKRLLDQALTHRSYIFGKDKDRKTFEANEELEFFGDAVLGLIVSEYFYRKFPHSGEGKLSRLRANIVNRDVLYPKALALRLGEFLLISRSEEKSGGRKRVGLLADVLEALIGAIYIEGGLRKAGRFVLTHFKEELEKADHPETFRDYKSLLQEHIQRKCKTIPHYRVFSTEGPDHKKVFSVSVECNSRLYGTGKGLSKKEAEQKAAKIAYKNFFSIEK